jgi:hypothetical protein
MSPPMDWLEKFLLFRSDRALSFLLLFLVLLLFVVYPFFSLEGFGKYLIDVGFALVLISATFAVERRGLRRVAFGLATVSLLTRWATYATPNRELLLANVIIGLVFLVFAAFAILGRVFASGPVTRHRVEGAVAVYLLLGLIFGSVYALIAMTVPDAFATDTTMITITRWSRETYDEVMGAATYFSFITLTTVGYGDVTPLNEVAKQFTVLEALIGQLYPAILLARLVSLQVTTRTE